MGAEGYSEELQLNQQDPPTEEDIWNVILSFKESFLLFAKYLRYKLNLGVRRCDVGSLLTTVECSSLQSLEGLWEDYCSGHLNEIAQEVLVTTNVLEKLGLTDVKLKTFLSEEEYEKGKQIFMDNSENKIPASSAEKDQENNEKVTLQGTEVGGRSNGPPYRSRKHLVEEPAVKLGIKGHQLTEHLVMMVVGRRGSRGRGFGGPRGRSQGRGGPHHQSGPGPRQVSLGFTQPDITYEKNKWYVLGLNFRTTPDGVKNYIERISGYDVKLCGVVQAKWKSHRDAKK
ncbi:death effector domain-containing [Desmophyllum pertusum]|uniref:Death effector domain-containing n=1 Tax=Desmophyllum pertusum TaxID=174260 RepID=A0A9W9ZHI7_9CNID|nr:death effector domain-containing [Desmophyllum pertusum]